MTHCLRHRIYSPGPCPACVVEWTQSNSRAIAWEWTRTTRERIAELKRAHPQTN